MSTVVHEIKSEAKAVTQQAEPTISVVITCYNHGRYLADAVESVLSQELDSVEIVVVDDGSTDNTKEVSSQYEDVKYVWQPNQGLSSARNTGIRESTGDYVVFLDADDSLLPGALKTNAEMLDQHPHAAFVSGAHKLFYEESGKVDNVRKEANGNHYRQFLQEGNFVGMHAAVMYQRWVFDHVLFDTSLRACEDYDIYLKISRKYPIVHHHVFIATYRFHESNMSGNTPMMLEAALNVLKRQEPALQSNAEKRSYKKGVTFWGEYYGGIIYRRLFFAPTGRRDWNDEERTALWKHSKKLYIKALLKKSLMPYTSFIKRLVPVFVLRWLHKAGLYGGFLPPAGKVKLGDMNRIYPFSTRFGYDRGGPVDRYYIENFLNEEKDCIHGSVLEIGDNEYTTRFGGSRVSKSDILHVDDSNKSATIVGDLSNAPHIADNSFDCIVLTQTLHMIYDVKKVIETCHRILKPGGTLLATVPGIGHIDQGEWYKYWMWAFTDNSIKRMFNEVFPAENTTVATYGNVLVASAFLYGMGVKELKKAQLDYCDPHYQVIISVKAVKPLA